MENELFNDITSAWCTKTFGGSFYKDSLHPNDVYLVNEIGLTIAEDALVFRFPGSFFDLIKAEDIVDWKYEETTENNGKDLVKHWYIRTKKKFIRAYSENYHIRIL